MTPTTRDTETCVRLERFAPMHGWANRLLRVDLTSRTLQAQPMEEYLPDYLGGRGVAARIAWDEYPRPVDPFEPESPLIIMTGALTGTRSPYSGRTAICGFAPQAWPYPWFTRANIGHHWGAELKRAGYDGIVITGASKEPVQIVIDDDTVRIAPADHLWGLDAYDTQEAVRDETGPGIRTLTIGQAGERLSRIATIHTATSSAAGQGGFGAVMGAKRLKAISVRGSGRPTIAAPESFDRFIRQVGDEIRAYHKPQDIRALKEKVRRECGGDVRLYACTAACPTPCNLYYKNIKGTAYPDRTWEGHWACVGGLLRGMGPRDGSYDWRLGTAAGLEMNVLSNRYGLNQWDLIIGMVPWLERCQEAGLISDLNGTPMDWRDPTFWAKFLKDITFREGIGNILAEGGWRAAHELDLGLDLLQRSYTAWGYAGHWDGHGCEANYLVFPYWIVSALQWMTDTRDPYSSSHGYVQNVMRWCPLDQERHAASAHAHVTWDELRAIGERVYGGSASVDPFAGYEHKAFPAFYHDARSVMKDSLPTDDQVFPLIYSSTTPDRYFRIGEIEGPSVDYHLFRLGTGTEWEEPDFQRAAERIYALERALNVRHWGRDRTMDESLLPAFEYKENWANPLLGEKHALDRDTFRPVADEYYRLLGWDVETGRPTQQRLDDLGIGETYEPMMRGAAEAEGERQDAPEPSTQRA